MQNKVQYLRIILTNRCNLSCYFCHKEGFTSLDNAEIHSKELIKLLRCFYKAGIHKFKFMGGEPTLRNDFPLILNGMGDYLDKVDSSIITNGLFEQDYMNDCLKAGLTRVNVSIQAWNEGQAIRKVGMSRSDLEKIVMNIDYLRNKGKLTKLNYVVLKSSGYGELFNLIEWINKEKLVLDVLNVLYTEAHSELENDYCDYDEIYKIINDKFKIVKKFEYNNRWSLPSTRLTLDGGGIINLKTNQLNNYNPFNSCKECSRHYYCREGIKAIRLTADGYIKPCLFREDNLLNLYDIVHKDEKDIIKAITQFIENL